MIDNELDGEGASVPVSHPMTTDPNDITYDLDDLDELLDRATRTIGLIAITSLVAIGAVAWRALR